MGIPLPPPVNQCAYSLSSYSITLALPAFYSPYRALYFTLRVSLIGIVHMLWLPSLPALPWVPPRAAGCTRPRRLHYHPARAPYLPHLLPVMRSTTLTTTVTVLNQHPMALSGRMPMLYAICRYIYAFMRI
jgi:hypothetical protein